MSALAVVSAPADRDLDDLNLVAGVRAGDNRAFDQLFVRYQPRIAAYVGGMVHDDGRAEEITQEVFISALRRMRETEREIAFKPWIYEIARNACIDAFRRSRNVTLVSFDAHDAVGAEEHGRLVGRGATPDVAVEDKLAFDSLRGAFGGLSPVHHDILVMREFEGLSYREIGERLGMSRSAVESTLFRARKRLSEEYEELVSGKRCQHVQRIVDASGGRTTRLRDQRRMARHLAHCQPCRRYARLAGADLGEAARPARTAAARIAAFLPLPAFLRKRWSGDEPVQLLGHQAGGPVAQWSANVAGVLDPGMVSGWAKAIATAATVAVAGIGTGAAVTGSTPMERFRQAVPPFVQAPGSTLSGARRQVVASGAAPSYGSASARAAPREQITTSAPSAQLSEPAATVVTQQPSKRPASVGDNTAATGAPVTRVPTTREERAPSAAADVGRQVTDTAGGAARNTGVGGGGPVVPAAPVGSAPAEAAAPTVASVVGTGSQAAQTATQAAAGSAPPPTAATDSVSSTVSGTLTNTTPTLPNLGG